MKLSKRILACAITAAMATSMLSACNGSTTTSGSASDAGTSQGNSSTTENSNSGDNSSTDGNGGSNGGNIVEAPSNGDTLKWLGYYDLNTDDKEIVDKFNDAGYKVETISTSSTEYFTKLAQLVASSDSPDMVRYEWQSYPHGVANNLYTSLDAYVDFDSDTWSGMKDMIENFNYGGKHCQFSSLPCMIDLIPVWWKLCFWSAKVFSFFFCDGNSFCLPLLNSKSLLLCNTCQHFNQNIIDHFKNPFLSLR